MSLNLDPRRRAMLREMGIRVWQPEAPVAKVPFAIESVAAHAYAESATGRFTVDRRPAEALAAPHSAHGGSAPASWLLGDAQALFAETAQPGGARWLVLAETPALSLQAPVFEGDAGKLLGNMLRAARLDRAGAVLFATLVRQAAAAATAQELPLALRKLIAHAQPDVVLVMGRLAAQALLNSTEPFGKLRGKVHLLNGAKTVVTCSAAYLLYRPTEKAGAWSDLCLAMSLVSPAA